MSSIRLIAKAALLSTFIVLFVSSGSVRGDLPDLCGSTADGAGGCWLVCPAGDGPRLDEFGGVITVVVRDIAGFPIAGIPASDFWLYGCADGLVLCGGSHAIDADGPTDLQGQTTISGAMAAGGCDDGLWVIVQGIVLSDPADCGVPLCLPYTVRSPDITADLVVNLADFSAFAVGYISPPKPYNKCLDFNCDGVVNLVDFARFAAHYLHQCG